MSQTPTPTPPPSAGPPPVPKKPLSESDARMYAMLCHLGGLAAVIVPVVGNVVVPLVIWLLKREESEFVADQGKEAVNFQITVSIASAVATALVLAGVRIIGVPLVSAITLANLIFMILAALETHKGNRYRYPVALRLIK